MAYLSQEAIFDTTGRQEDSRTVAQEVQQRLWGSEQSKLPVLLKMDVKGHGLTELKRELEWKLVAAE